MSWWRSIASRTPLTCAWSIQFPTKISSQDSIALKHVASSLCRIATQLWGPVLWRYEGQRPWKIKWHLLRVWRGISARWTRWEHTLHLSEMPSLSCNNTHKNDAWKRGPSILGVSLSINRTGDRKQKDSGGVNHQYKTCIEIMSNENSKHYFLYSTLETKTN
jgi:hypothetical protein